MVHMRIQDGTNMTPLSAAAALTRRLLAFDTINPPGQEEACADYLGGLLEQAGFRTEKHAFAPGRPSLVARRGAALDGGAALCFTGHIDTVPLGAQPWHHDPFAGTVEDGRM